MDQNTLVDHIKELKELKECHIQSLTYACSHCNKYICGTPSHWYAPRWLTLFLIDFVYTHASHKYVHVFGERPLQMVSCLYDRKITKIVDEALAKESNAKNRNVSW